MSCPQLASSPACAGAASDSRTLVFGVLKNFRTFAVGASSSGAANAAWVATRSRALQLAADRRLRGRRCGWAPPCLIVAWSSCRYADARPITVVASNGRVLRAGGNIVRFSFGNDARNFEWPSPVDRWQAWRIITRRSSPPISCRVAERV